MSLILPDQNKCKSIFLGNSFVSWARGVAKDTVRIGKRVSWTHICCIKLSTRHDLGQLLDLLLHKKLGENHLFRKIFRQIWPRSVFTSQHYRYYLPLFHKESLSRLRFKFSTFSQPTFFNILHTVESNFIFTMLRLIFFLNKKLIRLKVKISFVKM